MVAHLGGCLSAQTPSAQATHSLSAADLRLKSVLAACHQEIAGWSLLKRFETAHYSLALCQQGNTLVLLGQEKNVERLVRASAQINQETIVAEGTDRFSYEIRQGTLTVKKRGNIVVQEGIQ